MSWFEELVRPSNIINLVIAIVFFIAGVLTPLYIQRYNEKISLIGLEIEQTKIYDKERMEKFALKIFGSNGREVLQDAYAAKIVMWNAGKVKILSEDIRFPYRFKIGDGFDPSKFKITRYTNSNIGEFNVADDGTLSWKYFDPGEGLEALVIYVSDAPKKIYLEGFSVGTNLAVSQSVDGDNPWRGPWDIWWWVIWVGVFVVIVATIHTWLIGFLERKRENKSGFSGWIGPTGPKAAETLATLPVPSFTRRVRQNSAT